jgi:hypothetical protein
MHPSASEREDLAKAFTTRLSERLPDYQFDVCDPETLSHHVPSKTSTSSASSPLGHRYIGVPTKTQRSCLLPSVVGATDGPFSYFTKTVPTVFAGLMLVLMGLAWYKLRASTGSGSGSGSHQVSSSGSGGEANRARTQDSQKYSPVDSDEME